MKKFLNDMLGQAWTLLGMFVAWLVLEGSAKEIVGWAILGTMGVWVLSYPLRNSTDKEDE
jgi:putative Mn2+ efflux pump MntP